MMKYGKPYLITRGKNKMAVPRVRERLQRVQKEQTNDYMPNDSLLYSVDSCLPNPDRVFCHMANPAPIECPTYGHVRAAALE